MTHQQQFTTSPLLAIALALVVGGSLPSAHALEPLHPDGNSAMLSEMIVTAQKTFGEPSERSA